MNQTQRKFLIDKLEKKSRDKINELKKEKHKYPSTSNYIFKAVLNGTIKIADNKTIIAALTERALKAKEGENWLEPKTSFRDWSEEKERDMQLSIKDLILVPSDYEKEFQSVDKHNIKIDEKIQTLERQVEMLILRVQLASDKKLERMINEVDDMGNLSLIDTKIKLLN